MQLTLKNPIVENGVSYPMVAVQMVINPQLRNGGYVNSVIVNFTAFRVLPNGTVEALVDDPAGGNAPRIPSLLMSDATALAQRDAATGIAMAGILAAIQGYLNAKDI